MEDWVCWAGATPAGARRGALRASQAEREQAVETLKAAFVQGRLVKDEFEARLDQALTAKTRAELIAVTDDLPAAVTRDLPTAVTRDLPAAVTRDLPAAVTRDLLAAVTGDLPAAPAAVRLATPGRPIAGRRVLTLASVVTAASWAGAGSGPAAVLLAFTLTVIWLGIAILTASVALESRRQTRAAETLSPPGPAGRTSLGY